MDYDIDDVVAGMMTIRICPRGQHEPEISIDGCLVKHTLFHLQGPTPDLKSGTWTVGAPAGPTLTK